MPVKQSQGTVVAEPRKGHPRGGVSSKLGAPAARGTETLIEPRAVPRAAAAFPGFSYHGGPVIKCPQVYSTFWGSEWLSDPAHLTRAGRLSQFLKDLLASKYMNVLSQYGVGFGAGVAGAFIRATFLSNVPTTLSDASIQGIIQDCINSGVLPEPPKPSNIAVVVYLAESIGINDPGDGLVLCEASGDTAFGYHSFFSTSAGHPFYYAIIPGLNDTCLKESCPGNDTGCSLHLAETQEQRQTQVTSHEFAEMTTDPELNAWFDPAASENGDICNGESDTITVGGNTWTVQRQYSKTDDVNTNGATFCVTEAPNPLPKLSPGPAALTAGIARIQQLHSLNNFLPLPDVHFDLRGKKISADQKQMKQYAERLLQPFHHNNLVPGLPGLLRQLADTIEKL